MYVPPRLGWAGLLQLALVVALAAVLRITYLNAAADYGRSAPAFAVQGAGPYAGANQSSTLDVLVHHLVDDRSFASLAPLADDEERTGHVAPGYPWLLAQLSAFNSTPDLLMRWLQCALGAMSAGFLYLFARRAFGNPVVAMLAGTFAALHPFWIINTGELNEGVLATFLLAAALLLGTRGCQSGGAFTSLLFGLSLSTLAMVRPTLLPFGVVALLWYLYHCRGLRHGWFNAILAFLGFANGLAPWAVRNWNAFEEPVPVVTSAYLHLWIGNNPGAAGGPMDETALRLSFPPERLKELLAEGNQAKRYAGLGRDVVQEIGRDPAAAVTHRLQAAVKYVSGDAWFANQRMCRTQPVRDEADTAPQAEWLTANIEVLLQGSLLVLLVLGLLGWRWSLAWKRNARLAEFAFLLAPLPYVLSHAEELSGPRLPWDAVLICYSAYAVACLAPFVAGSAEPEA